MDKSASAGGSLSANISLPVLPVGKPKASRMSRKRAAVLILVNLIIIAHIVQWWMTGRTIAPLEPSEAMDTVKDGVVTVGFILFALALGSTLIFGRFFCGWGCHILALQDSCTWLMGKFGLRPHAFRSRLLLWLPLLLALYMFVWPLVYRLAIAPFTRPDLAWPELTFRLVVTDFWRTFPGIAVAIPFLFICGFVAVYLLGSKGYCTYGCPYGGFFAPIDRYAVGRIRVTDDCEQCGHCTATCTSNVRVHEEVRDFGMVVDPGCMKCMDCVSVCPNDALYFGFAFKTAANVAPPVVPPPSASSRWDLSLAEEWSFAAIAALTFFAVRGAYGVVPLLFASGIVICTVYLLWKAWRTLRDANVTMHWIALARGGKATRWGWWLRVSAAAWLLLLLHTGVINGIHTLAAAADDRVIMRESSVFTADGLEPEKSMADDARRAIGLYTLESSLGRGGIGIFSAIQPNIDMRLAWLNSVLREFATAEAILRAQWQREPGQEAFALAMGRVLMARADSQPAQQWYRDSLAAFPAMTKVRDEYVGWLIAEGRGGDAIEQARLGVMHGGGDPESDAGALNAMRRLSLVLIEMGETPAQWSEGVMLVQQTLQIAPKNAYGWRALALGHARLEQLPQAETALAKAVELAPLDARLRRGHADVLEALGRVEEANEARAAADRLEASASTSEAAASHPE